MQSWSKFGVRKEGHFLTPTEIGIMFASLGGDNYKPASSKVLDPNDEFHLGSIEDEKLDLNSTGDISSVQDIMDRHPVRLDELNHLQGAERDEASSRLYRKHALREKQLSNWIRSQCGTLFDEYQDCLKNASLRMPFFSCSTEHSAYAHCIDVTKVW